jgi:ribosomal 30S subunit maturation factor RimM
VDDENIPKNIAKVFDDTKSVMKFLRDKKHSFRVVPYLGKITLDIDSKNKRVNIQLHQHKSGESPGE